MWRIRQLLGLLGPPQSSFLSNVVLRKRFFAASAGQCQQDTNNLKLLEKALQFSGFRTIRPVADLSYYAWVPEPKNYTSSLANVTTVDIKSQLDLGMKPPVAIGVDKIRLELPTSFASLPPQEHEHAYPFNNYHIAALHAATQHRGLNLNEIDFYFGGSTLSMLADRNMTGNGNQHDMLAMLVPGTSTIVVVNNKAYTQDYSAPGFQFERLCTGQRFEDLHEEASVSRMMVMYVGNYKVFFEAEIDAVDSKGAGIEIKASNPRYWGTKVMFQMISSGSLTLYAGIKKGKDRLFNVESLSLEEVCAKAITGGPSSYSTIVAHHEANINLSIGELKEHIELLRSGGTYKVIHKKEGLTLEFYSETTCNFFPPLGVTNDLLLKP